MSNELSENANRVLLFHYVLAKGQVPEWAFEGTDGAGAQMRVFRRISGLPENETVAAYAELEDAGMIDKQD